jgi:hypothetical protein
MKAAFLSINWADVGKGFLVAVVTVILAGLATSIQDGNFPTLAQLGSLGLAGLSAGIAYLMKQFFTNSAGQLGSTEANVTTTSTANTTTTTVSK